MTKQTFGSFTRRVLTVIVLAAVALLAWQIASILLLAFAGVLLAVILHGIAKRISAFTPLSTRWAVPVAGLLIIGILVGIGWLIGPEVAQQLRRLGNRIPQTIGQLSQYAWGQQLLQQTPQADSMWSMILNQINVLSRITGVVSTTFNIIFNAVLVLFTGIFLALSPDWYRDGAARLVPRAQQPRLRDVLDATGRALWKWLLGTLISMVLIGILTTVGLLLLGVKLALALGVIAMLLEFIPYVGPILSAVPAVLLALMQGPTQALYVALFYLGIQQLESNVIYPLVQEQEVHLPPALTVVALAAFGVLFGIYGVLLASPLLVVVLVFVKMLYLEDVIGDPGVHVPGTDE